MHVRTYGKFVIIEDGERYDGRRFTVTANDGVVLATGLLIDGMVYWLLEKPIDPSVLSEVNDYLNL